MKGQSDDREPTLDDGRFRRPGRERRAFTHRGSRWPDPSPGRLPDRADGAVQQGADPRRQPHAKGSGAFGHFEVTHDVSRYTKAALFQPGTRTDLVTRFSTVAGERGSPDTWRDPRGFAVKFYTSEGNYDMVGNNTPVFFVKDRMKFQHFIRSQKRRADSNLRDHDMQWDFWTLSPESAHQVTWLMGDRGIPRTWRHMNGYTSHTYMWINASGERFWVKYHFKTDQGIEFFIQDEADRMAGADSDFRMRDLFDHIRDGDFPSWMLHVQVMPYEEAAAYRFNPFDLTKVWPHGDYPLLPVGRMTWTATPPTTTPRSSRPPSSRTTSCPASGPVPTACCSRGSSRTRTPTEPVSAPTTSSCP
jgi:catalase